MRTIPRLCLGLAVCAVSLGSMAALAQDSYDYRRGVNFSAIKTFAFKESAPMAPEAYQTTTYDSPIQRQRTQAAISAQLEARGMRHVDNNPDVYVVSHRTYKVDYTYYPGYGYGWGGPYAWGTYYGAGYYPGMVGWYGGGGYVYEQLMGTLTVDLEDARTGTLLWRGIETKHVHQTSKPAKRDKRVIEEVSEVFEHFPATGAVATTGVR
jgi:Domain of unknown function (DUF4136)